MRGLNKWIAGAFAALMAQSVFAGYTWNFPEPVTPIARETLHVHNLFMIIILIIFCGVLALMLYSFWAHRKSQGHKAATFTAPRSTKQWLFVLAPFAVLKVTGSQWMWQYEFPAEGVKFTSRLTTPRDQIDNKEAKGEHYLLEVDNPLVLPVGKKIRFITTSNDVIHSWWVPAFGVKRDAVPGFLREFWATVEKTGTYRGQCSELCGKEHAYMPVVVNVVPEEEFKAWIASRQKSGT